MREGPIDRYETQVSEALQELRNKVVSGSDETISREYLGGIATLLANEVEQYLRDNADHATDPHTGEPDTKHAPEPTEHLVLSFLQRHDLVSDHSEDLFRDRVNVSYSAGQPEDGTVTLEHGGNKETISRQAFEAHMSRIRQDLLEMVRTELASRGVVTPVSARGEQLSAGVYQLEGEQRVIKNAGGYEGNAEALATLRNAWEQDEHQDGLQFIRPTVLHRDARERVTREIPRHEIHEEQSIKSLAEYGADELPMKKMLEYLKQQLSGLKYLDKQGMFLTDLKVGNLFVDTETDEGVLADLNSMGLKSKRQRRYVTVINGRYNYIPPEVRNNTNEEGVEIGLPQSIYELGITFDRLATKYEREEGSLSDKEKSACLALHKLSREMTQAKPGDRASIERVSLELQAIQISLVI